jgi:hemolysin-activating ACP:hemolysin acyltransferase
MTPKPDLRLVRPPNGAMALGLAVSHLMTKPAFARLPFGDWSRVLVGQINRGSYAMVCGPRGQVAGFLGWAPADDAAAAAWLAGRASTAPSDGDCLIINAWSAETPDVNRILLTVARRIAVRYRVVCFKRHYPDGRTRVVTMKVPAFLQMAGSPKTPPHC